MAVKMHRQCHCPIPDSVEDRLDLPIKLEDASRMDYPVKPGNDKGGFSGETMFN